jgi:hypothetical protein
MSRHAGRYAVVMSSALMVARSGQLLNDQLTHNVDVDANTVHRPAPTAAASVCVCVCVAVETLM